MSFALDEAFKKLRGRVREIGTQSLGAVAVDAYKTIKKGYESLDVVRDESGKIVSRTHPSSVADNVSVVIRDDDVALVFIEGAEENLEARRQYSEGHGSDIQRNPFLAALYRLKAPKNLSEITGLERK